MDQGIIQACKVKYRHRLIQRFVVDLEAGIETKVNLKDAVHMLASAWNAVTASTIANCFRKAGFLKEHVSVRAEVEATGDKNCGDKATGEGRNAIQEIMVESNEENGNVEESDHRNLWDFIACKHNISTTLEEFMTVDQELATDDTHLTTDEEIIDAVVGEAIEEQEDSIYDDENDSDSEDEGDIR